VAGHDALESVECWLVPPWACSVGRILILTIDSEVV
jgi:hypothetical protein